MTMRRTLPAVLLLIGLTAWAQSGDDPDTNRTNPAFVQRPGSIGESMWNRLLQLDRRAATISSFSADFRQEKHTELLASPIVSRGTLRQKGPRLRWDTREPSPSTMVVSEGGLSIYYPEQQLLEQYPVTAQLERVVATPVPRLMSLIESFHIEAEAVRTNEEPGHAEGERELIRLRMTPRAEKAREHLESIEIVLDEARGCAVRGVITDNVGDRTVLTFEGIRINPEIPDASKELIVPEGTKVSRPTRR